MTELEFAARLAFGLGCGVAIGLERQWRQRLAGLRTTALVATGACLFVILSEVHSAAPSSDRIAAQIVSGIGFLGAGVIIRDGLGIRGLNTAATLWCAAAVGALAGAGLFLFAAGGSVAIVLANLLLRAIARRVDRRAGLAAETEVAYEFRAVCRAADEAHVRVLLVQAVLGGGFTLRGLQSQDINGGARVEVRAHMVGQGAGPALLEQAVSRLSLEPGVSAVSWHLLAPDSMSADGDREDGEVLAPSQGWEQLTQPTR
jgi:putative Mg2+ transporter-C (MgtC) family protein